MNLSDYEFPAYFCRGCEEFHLIADDPHEEEDE